ncbi:hypothetical protein CXB51_001829 [Gossypium anomalum]|uniref:Aminotransferase-like plant mobile domain-containing protein n=1 Tax=Gossypium anomalum TaxID=47600 RepID=A0A8J5ZPP3_9ROSI|nr:hypothetical protein CXB51_001829 [Gossypium anomalum]
MPVNRTPGERFCHLQLGLPVDESALTGSIQSVDWGAICYNLLGTILDNIYRGRIEMGWLRDTFPELGNDSTEVKRIRYARTYIIEMIREGRHQIKSKSEVAYHYYNHGLGSLSIFTSSSEPPIYIPTHNEFQWTPYEDPIIRAVISEEFFQNPNIWHVKVPLVNYASVEMHQTDRVLQQFEFQQLIPEEPEVLDEKHKINLW